MAFHVPFNQRASAQHHPGPIYIGFDVPAAPRRKFNWWGFHGMWMSFASLLSAGFLAPLPLLVSLNGLRKPGKKMATVGTLVSLAGIALATTIVFVTIAQHQYRSERAQQRHYQKVIGKQVDSAQALLVSARAEIEEFTAASGGTIQDEIEANMLVLKYVDPWQESLRLDVAGVQNSIRSAGPDKTFDTSDDLTLAIDVKSSTTSEKPRSAAKKELGDAAPNNSPATHVEL